MPLFDSEFDPKQHGSTNEIELLPAGSYEAQIVESSFEYNKAGTGQYLKLKFQVLNHPNVIWENLNLIHPNPKAVEIANAKLSDICRATTGEKRVRASEELHNIPMLVKVGVKPGSDGYSDSNVIKSYKALKKGEPIKDDFPY